MKLSGYQNPLVRFVQTAYLDLMLGLVKLMVMDFVILIMVYDHHELVINYVQSMMFVKHVVLGKVD